MVRLIPVFGPPLLHKEPEGAPADFWVPPKGRIELRGDGLPSFMVTVRIQKNDRARQCVYLVRLKRVLLERFEHQGRQDIGDPRELFRYRDVRSPFSRKRRGLPQGQ